MCSVERAETRVGTGGGALFSFFVIGWFDGFAKTKSPIIVALLCTLFINIMVNVIFVPITHALRFYHTSKPQAGPHYVWGKNDTCLSCLV